MTLAAGTGVLHRYAHEAKKFEDSSDGGTCIKTIDASTGGIKFTNRVSATLTYVGLAPHNSLGASAVWQITRISLQGAGSSAVEVIEQAAGGLFTQVWNNRASLFSVLARADNFCLLLDGVNDHVSFGDNLNKERTDSFTWSFWFRPRIVTTTQTLYSKRNASSIGLEIKMLSNGRLDWTAFGVTGSQSLRMQMGTSLLPETWYHVVFSYAGNSLPAGVILYLNNTVPSLTTIVNTPLASSILVTTAALLGQYNNTQFVDGHLNECKLYNRVLTAAEVTELWNHGAPLVAAHSADANLQADYPLGDGDTYPVMSDNKGTVHGTLIGGTAATIVEVP